MRRLMRLAWSLTVLAALAWSAVWVGGRDIFTRIVDAQIAEVERRGTDIAYRTGRVGGFPFGYTTTLEDVVVTDRASGARSRLGEVTARLGAERPGLISARLSERIVLQLPAGPGPLEIEVQSSGLRVEAGLGSAPGEGLIAIRADRLAIAPALPDTTGPAGSAELSVEDLRFVARQAGRGPARAELTAAALGLSLDRLVAAPQGPDGGASTPEAWRYAARLDGLRAGAVASDPGPRGLGAFLAGLPAAPEARLTVELSAEALRADVSARDTGTADGRIELGAGSSEGALTLGAGRSTSRLTLSEINLAILPPAEGYQRRDAIAATALTLRAHQPLPPAERPEPLAIALRLDGVAPEPELWGRLDPERALPRLPGTLALDLEGEARYGPAALAAGPVIEIVRLGLSRFALDALGARAEATGELSFSAPTGQPVGRASLQFSGAIELLRRLNRAGLIDEQTLQVLATTAAFYTRAGEAPDELTVDLSLGPAGLVVNGEPLR